MVKLQPMEEYSHPAALSGKFADVSSSTIAEFKAKLDQLAGT